MPTKLIKRYVSSDTHRCKTHRASIWTTLTGHMNDSSGRTGSPGTICIVHLACSDIGHAKVFFSLRAGTTSTVSKGLARPSTTASSYVQGLMLDACGNKSRNAACCTLYPGMNRFREAGWTARTTKISGAVDGWAACLRCCLLQQTDN